MHDGEFLCRQETGEAGNTGLFYSEMKRLASIRAGFASSPLEASDSAWDTATPSMRAGQGTSEEAEEAGAEEYVTCQEGCDILRGEQDTVPP